MPYCLLATPTSSVAALTGNYHVKLFLDGVRGLLLANVATVVADAERKRIFPDEVEHILRAVDDQLDVRARFSCRIAAAQKINRLLTARIPAFQLLPLRRLVLCLIVFIGDGKRDVLLLHRLQTGRHDL